MRIFRDEHADKSCGVVHRKAVHTGHRLLRTLFFARVIDQMKRTGPVEDLQELVGLATRGFWHTITPIQNAVEILTLLGILRDAAATRPRDRNGQWRDPLPFHPGRDRRCSVRQRRLARRSRRRRISLVEDSPLSRVPLARTTARIDP